LQDYVNQRLARIPRQIEVSVKLPGRLTIECDEMWSFVDSKKNEIYIWLAIDHNSREIVGCFIGDRTRKSARQFWASLPDVYQQSAAAYTDFGQAYTTVIPRKQHRAVGKGTGQTNRIERLNNTFRQRVSRLVRASLSFSKKLNNHKASNLVLHSWLQCRTGKDLSLTTTFISLPVYAVYGFCPQLLLFLSFP
jgi:IS1 family transposase